MSAEQRLLLVLAAALTVAMPAAAQQSRTTCRAVGGQLVCDTAPSGIDWNLAKPPAHQESFMDAYERGRQMAAERAAQEQAAAQADAEASENVSRRFDAEVRRQRAQHVGALIADGHCDDARGIALRSGDLELAERVATLCSPASAPPHP